VQFGVALGLSFDQNGVTILDNFARSLSQDDELQVVHWENWTDFNISTYTRQEINNMDPSQFRQVVTPVIRTFLNIGKLYVNIEGVDERFGDLHDFIADDAANALYEGTETHPFAMELLILSEEINCDLAKFYETANVSLSSSDVDICGVDFTDL